MSLNTRKIASNAVWYMVALTLQKIISFVYFTLLARYLGPEDIGKYFFATSFVLIFAVFTDLGLSLLLTREVAKKEDSNQLVSQVVSLKILTSLVVMVALIFIAPLIVHDTTGLILVLLAAAAMILDGFTLIFYAAIRGRQSLGYESIATIIHQAIILTVGLVLMSRNADVVWLMTALVIASTFNFLYSMAVLRFKADFHLHLLWHMPLIRTITVTIIPFALAAIFTRIYAYIDSVLLKVLLDDQAVGLYSIAYKATFAFQFIPLAFVASLYPAFSYYWSHNREQLSQVLSRAIYFLLITSIPIAACLASVAPALVPALYTESFRPSVLPLQILLSTLPFLFINFPLGYLLNAINLQGKQTKILGLTMVYNIIANLILIPLLGPTGAAIASSTGTVIAFIFSWRLVSKQVSVDKSLRLATMKILALGLGMVILNTVLLPYIHWLAVTAISLILYAGGLAVLKLITKDDAQYFLSLLKKQRI